MFVAARINAHYGNFIVIFTSELIFTFVYSIMVIFMASIALLVLVVFVAMCCKLRPLQL